MDIAFQARCLRKRWTPKPTRGYASGMKRFLLILLMLLVPLQFAQAAVCSYCCEDEHAVLQQQADSPVISAADTQSGNADTVVQHACASCHMACAKLLLGMPSVPVAVAVIAVQHAAPIPLYHSPMVLGPERPDWLTAA